ncbi:hypothetical protein E4U42_006694 [Claviceps africana]|uniref:Uncharacterized protein n=1 Tax=Claviceps africana TaxID=83212 RepID=A0A8K0J2P6_9HYPO|nr:hypothetical protein E4U42_006694 [Claviceps africana]
MRGHLQLSPGGALLRSSRMFSVPKPLPEPPSWDLHIGDHKSSTMTRHYPQHQSITTPLSSREKGDWGLKRPLPLKSTLATSTPLIRVKQVDSVENVTDFASAADHSLSLEKFQELRVALSFPRGKAKLETDEEKPSMWPKSVFEEELDYTDYHPSRDGKTRWKFHGPWLARMHEGDFVKYLNKTVRPKRARFRQYLMMHLAKEMTTAQNKVALDSGEPLPPKVEIRDITAERFREYVKFLRADRIILYELISKFLHLAPLGSPFKIDKAECFTTNVFAKTGPPPTHPSAGISYLRTSSYMENHPLYGPQDRRTPALARVVYPRIGQYKAKLGVGGFVADVPSGDNEFNIRYARGKAQTNKLLKGIGHLDTSTYGGAKAYIDPYTATVDPSGKIILELRETKAEARVIARESKGLTEIYHSGHTSRYAYEKAAQAEDQEHDQTADSSHGQNTE